MRKLSFGTKHVGILILVTAFALLFLLFSLTSKISEMGSEKCSCPALGEICPMETKLPIQTYLGIVFILVLSFLGLFLILVHKETRKETKQKSAKILKTIRGEERKIYEAIISSDGTIFQSELVEKTGFNKVKVTRILDKLEGMGLIERRRRGMTNIVILKT